MRPARRHALRGVEVSADVRLIQQPAVRRPCKILGVARDRIGRARQPVERVIGVGPVVVVIGARGAVRDRRDPPRRVAGVGEELILFRYRETKLSM